MKCLDNIASQVSMISNVNNVVHVSCNIKNVKFQANRQGQLQHREFGREFASEMQFIK